MVFLDIVFLVDSFSFRMLNMSSFPSGLQSDENSTGYLIEDPLCISSVFLLSLSLSFSKLMLSV
jgi:hypothetical protein